MYKVFNQGPKLGPGRTFLLTDPKDPKHTMRILPKATANVPDEFAGDVTFRKAVAAGELVIWQEAKEVDKLLKDSEAAGNKTNGRKPARNGKNTPEKDAKEEKDKTEPKTQPDAGDGKNAAEE